MKKKENIWCIWLMKPVNGRCGDTVPVGPVHVSVQLPEGRKISAVRAVIEEQKISWKEEAGRAEIDLDRLEVWEMLAIEF